MYRLLLLAGAPAKHCEHITEKIATAQRRNGFHGTDVDRGIFQYHCPSVHPRG